MFFVAWRIWKLWLPEKEVGDGAQPTDNEHKGTESTSTLFDVLSRWALWGTVSEDDQVEEENDEGEEEEETAELH